MTDDNTYSLINAWKQFKQINDARLQEIKRKGSADALYDDYLHKINVTLDSHEPQMSHAQSCPACPSVERTRNEDGEYGKAFRNYLRKGMDSGLESLQTMAISAASDPDGGYLVTPTMSRKIVQGVFEASPMRHVCAVETISTDSLDLIDDHASTAAGWTVETALISETSTPKLAKRNIPTHEIYAQPKATQKLVNDSAIDVEGWLAGKIGDIFSRTQNTAFIAGTGVGQPRGILTYAAGTGWGQVQQIGSGANAQVTSDALASLYYSLKDTYTRRATFLMNRTTVQQVRLLKQTLTDQYMWQPSFTAGSPDTLMGVPLLAVPDMPAPSHGALSVALGDFQSGYQIVDRQGISILRDPFTEKPFVKFYATARVGSDVVDFDAIKLLKLAA